MKRAYLLLALLTALLVVAPATARAAARLAYYSVQGLENSMDGDELIARIRSFRGLQHARFDHVHCEIEAWVRAGVSDQQVVEIIQKAAVGLRALPGRGQGRYVPLAGYDSRADVVVVTDSGARVGPLERLAVKGKTTIFDVYAVWCAPCRALDARFHELVARRNDIAIRKLNVVSFDSPLAKELGPRLYALPHVIVFTPDGKRHDFDGAVYDDMAKTLGW